MTLTQFDYLAPAELDGAISALQEPGSVALAGGHHVLTLLKRRELTAQRLVDLRGVRELFGVEADAAGALRIGAMTTLTELLAYVRAHAERGSDALADAITGLGDRQSRNRVTVGGQLAAGRVGNDLAAALMVFGATAHLAGAQGPRSVPLTDLWGPGSQLELRAGELITALLLEPAPTGSGFARMTNRATLEAVCGVAAAVTCAPDGRVEHCRIAAVGAMARPGRIAEMENWALTTGAQSGELAPPPAGVPFVNDHLASAEYRRYMTRVLAGRALDLALGRAAR